VYLRVLAFINSRGGSRSRDWRGPYGERGARAYNGVQGQSPWSGGQGAKPPEAERFLVLSYFEMALNCYVYKLFIVINGSCSTNMYARQLSFNFSSMVWGGGHGPVPPLGSAPDK